MRDEIFIYVLERVSPYTGEEVPVVGVWIPGGSLYLRSPKDVEELIQKLKEAKERRWPNEA